MVAQVPIAFRMTLHELRIVNKSRPVAKLPCEARMRRQKSAHIAICRTHILVDIGPPHLAAFTVGITTHFRIRPEQLPQFGLVVQHAFIVHDAWIFAITLREVRIVREKSIPLLCGTTRPFEISRTPVRILANVRIVREKFS